MNILKTRWLIWSIEHGAWWKPNSRGYTESSAEAGRYTFTEAFKIVSDANRYPKKLGIPNEAMLPDKQ